MSRALLALSLFISAGWAKDSPTAKPDKKNPHPRPALSAAVCGGDGPELLAKPAEGTTPPESAVAGAISVPKTKNCGDTLADLPDDTEIALRPSAKPGETPDAAAVDESFKKSMKLSDLEILLQKKAQALGIKDLGAERLAALFDKDKSARANLAQLATTAREALGDEKTNAAAKKTVAQAIEEAKKNPAGQPYQLKKTPVPPTPGFDPELGKRTPPERPSSSVMSQPNYTDGSSWWSRGRTPPQSLLPLPSNPQGIPSNAFQNPSKSDVSAPVWAAFKKKFDECRPDPKCEPYNFGIWRAGSMCHSVGAAIDVHAMKCPDGIHTALQNGKFAQLVACMSGKDGKQTERKVSPIFAIWHQCFINCSPPNNTNYHRDHAHFSIGCGYGRK